MAGASDQTPELIAPAEELHLPALERCGWDESQRPDFTEPLPPFSRRFDLGDIRVAIAGGSLQKVTIDRVLRLVDAAGLEAEIRVRRAA